MSINLNQQYIGIFPAANDTLVRYTGLKLVNGQLETAGAGEQCLGVCDLDAPREGQAVQVQVEGIAKVIAAGTIAADTQVTVDANGQLVAAGGGDYILGYTIKAVGAANEVGEVYLTKNTQA
jgi:hypothetical protein